MLPTQSRIGSKHYWQYHIISICEQQKLRTRFSDWTWCCQPLYTRVQKANKGTTSGQFLCWQHLVWQANTVWLRIEALGRDLSFKQIHQFWNEKKCSAQKIGIYCVSVSMYSYWHINVLSKFQLADSDTINPLLVDEAGRACHVGKAPHGRGMILPIDLSMWRWIYNLWHILADLKTLVGWSLVCVQYANFFALILHFQSNCRSTVIFTSQCQKPTSIETWTQWLVHTPPTKQRSLAAVQGTAIREQLSPLENHSNHFHSSAPNWSNPNTKAGDPMLNDHLDSFPWICDPH